jgi:hypothetical protein
MAIRTAVLALAAATLLFSGGANSQTIYEGPWCAIVMIGEGSVAERCDMRSLEMCQAEIRGQGASHCTQNPRYYAKAPANPRKKQRLQ